MKIKSISRKMNDKRNAIKAVLFLSIVITGSSLPYKNFIFKAQEAIASSSGFLGSDFLSKGANKNIIRLNYDGFTVWEDCSLRGPIKFQYVAHRDSGSMKRYDKFFLDPKVPRSCQQLSAAPYGKGYDRGHLVPANHLDSSERSIKETNTMTNILPQAAGMNRGAWLETEEIIECYRDIDELLVIGGVIWGNDKKDDFFTKSHGVATPSAFWKVVIRGATGSERVISWIVPNSQKATRKNLDSYLVSIDEIEKKTKEKIPAPDYLKNERLSSSWVIPIGCNKG